MEIFYFCFCVMLYFWFLFFMGDVFDVCVEGFWKIFFIVIRVYYWKNYIFFISVVYCDFKWVNSCCNLMKIWKRSVLVVWGYKECLFWFLGKKMLLFGIVINFWEFKLWWLFISKMWYIKGIEVGCFFCYKIIMVLLKVVVCVWFLNNRWNIMICYFINIFVSGICFDVI